ncbi:pilus assembly protein [Methylophaga sp.]|uniref:pilus assembly protein n=1 Tax=Methylophaga sp. TaxID=2024840 RepID=UPI003A92876A
MNKLSSFTALVLLGIYSLTSSAANLNISNVPLYLGGVVAPNIMFTLDDSGSMQWEVMPDENLHYANYLFPRPSSLYGGVTYSNQVPNFDDDNVHNFFSRSSVNNAVFYNPDVTYVPWSKADGTSMGNANPSAALYNPADPSRGSINLKTQQTQYSCWFKHGSSLSSAYGDPCNGNHSFWPITYYKYNGSASDSEALRLDRSRYTRVRITDSTSASTTFTSPNGTTRTRDEEIQNFANWFQYYRSRILTARAGVGRAFATQSENSRVGFAAINEGSRTIDGVSSNRALIRGVRKFSGANRTAFYDNLYDHVINNYGTPLRSAAASVGQYYERTDNRGPWGANPGTDDSSAHLTCRQSYHILTTDGYWNGGSPGLGNVDSSNGTTISGPNDDDYTYLASPPFSDSWSNTLADTAMHYWKRDLRTDLENEVPTNTEDPAFWQHMVTFTVGLGVKGSLDPENDLDALSATPPTKSWPDPGSSNPAKIDDLWHAAVNSHGNFFSAADPDEFAESLAGILQNITSRTSSSAAVAVNSGAITSDSKVYQARFNSGDWTGRLLAFGFDDDGQLLPSALWDAANKIPSADQRVIFTSDGNNGYAFDWNALNSSQKLLLGSEDVLNYLRGNQSKEQSKSEGIYRTRTKLLGDIINSSPVLLGPPRSDYYDQWGNRSEDDEPEDSVLYSEFVSTYLNRTAMIYVGANDGMLHAFDADSGVEKFAYVPNSVYNNLKELSSPSYSHKYYVDASPTVVDAFFDGSWHTVLVSGLGAGGQGYFALDITDPSAFSNETESAKKVLWEFTDKNDPDIGYTMGQANIVRLNNGKWAALFSGGYNNTFDNDADGSANNASHDSDDGNGYIYIVDLETGSLIRKFDTQTGKNEDPTEQFRPNGIATPTAIDTNQDGTTDLIYAGDMFGNVWSIEIGSNNKNDWDFTYRDADTNKPLPLYSACFGTSCNKDNIQPITTPVKVELHNEKNGYLLLFGTGKYFEVGDNTPVDQVTQSFYAIWDPRVYDADTSSYTRYAFSRAQLNKRAMAEFTILGTNYRTISASESDKIINWGTANTDDRGWYVDLVSASSGENSGERQVSEAIIRDEKVIFTSLVPSEDACDFGGSSWLMELDYYTGLPLNYQPLDINGDGVIDANDLYVDTDGDGEPDTEVPVVAAKGYDSIISPPKISRRVPGSGSTEVKFMSDAETGELILEEESSSEDAIGRRSWIQLTD